MKLIDKVQDGLAVSKNRMGLPLPETAAQMGIGRDTLRQLLKGKDVRLTLTQWEQVFKAAGIKIVV